MTNTIAVANTITKIGWGLFMLILMGVSVFLALQVKNMTDHTHDADSDHVVCFSLEMCAINVNGIWYQIEGTIDMDETIPDNYLPHAEIKPGAVSDNPSN